MRNIVRVAVPLGKAVTADVGFLNQLRPAQSGARAQIDHALNLRVSVNLGTLGLIGLHDWRATQVTLSFPIDDLVKTLLRPRPGRANAQTIALAPQGS